MEIILVGFLIIIMVYCIRDLVELFFEIIKLNFLVGVSLVVLILFIYYETAFLCDLLNNGIFN
jgi:hypothetical protein